MALSKPKGFTIMSITTVTITFKLDTVLLDDTYDFFHLDAEIYHKNVYEFQVLSFDKERKLCVAELYLHSAVDESKLPTIFDGSRLSVSVDCREVKYSDLTITA
jgi:hypothetical protein